MNDRYPLFRLAVLFLAALTLASAAFAQSPGRQLWTDVEESAFTVTGKRTIVPQRYRTVVLDEVLLDEILAAAPSESQLQMKSDGATTILSLPLPDGGSQRFSVVESPIMEPGLAAKFPEIKTYRAQGLDDPAATARIDETPAGFHAMILSPKGDIYIDPYENQNNGRYVSYWARNLQRHGPPFSCGVRYSNSGGPKTARSAVAKALSGTTLRTYRLAVAATGEYTAFHGGTVAQGQAAIVTAMNRVNGIYEREVAIRMVLVANNDQLVYTNSSTDPYTNNNGSTMLGQNQSTVDSVIGSSNYDIGHVFSTGGGGVAYLGVPCKNGSKAGGVTGRGSPVGDAFWVDYVAHEMGHQWGGNHTFNGSAGSCSGGNRNGSTAYEPGSGTTIQAYAGICGTQNIQNNSDDYFHGVSLDEIIAYSTTGSGNNCPTTNATGNNPPSVNAGAAYTIPLNTPFELCGSATDPDGDSLTYGWEEFDLGAAGAPNSPSGNAPIFRTFLPTTSPCRTFPQTSDLVNNTQTIGELLPTYTRTMSFRLTARDNRSGGGGVADDSTTVTVASSGPFRVTAPNTAVTWAAGTTQNVTWDVAGTDLSPVSCSAVDITLSTDGGATYGTTLASGVANNGSASVTVPGTPTTSARVRVQCAGNIFFDISNADFTIDATSGSPPAVSITSPADGSSSESGQPVTFTGTASDPEDGDLSSSLAWTSSIDGSIGSGASFSTSSLSLGSHTITASVTDSNALTGSDSINVNVTPVGGGNGPQNAVYDSGLGAPRCDVAGSSCDSQGLLDGRGTVGPEPNQPNTIDGCTDGTSGTYHSDESIDRIVVSTLNGADFTEGATVEVAVTVYAYSTGTSDTLDLYYTADANSPSWQLIGSYTSGGGIQTMTAQYTLPAGALQAIRANYRYQGSPSSCTTGSYDDADDLVFAVGGAGPECTIDADCDDGLFCNGTETCNAGSCAAGSDPCPGQSCDEGGDVCTGGSNGPQDASYDAGLGAPACAVAGSECDSLTLLDGRGTVGPEPNQPNTLDACTDGSSGTYHSDESNDRIVVRTLDGADMTEGATVEVALTVYAYSTGSSDTLDLYYTADANSPSWNLIGSYTSAGGVQTITAQYTLPAGSLQAVRANYRYQGSQSTCSTGDYDDTDDLAFAVGAGTPPPGCTVDDDFEGGAAGWTNDAASTCTTGDYVTGNPTNASSGYQIVGSHSGTTSLYTADNSSAGVDDVDGGNCILSSPAWTVADASTLSVWYWHGQRDAGDDPSGDFFVLEYSTDGGSSWTAMASNGDTTSNPAWTEATAAIAAGSDVRVRVQCSDGTADGDLVECGIDDVSICPQ